MRKLQRSILRHYAESRKLKVSKYVRTSWHEKQNKKYGIDIAAKLRSIGTGKCAGSRKAMRLLSRKGVI